MLSHNVGGEISNFIKRRYVLLHIEDYLQNVFSFYPIAFVNKIS